ncbi:MAG: hypothetical protein ACRD16_09015, partial [Thermoanaerobaculia bacterium]
MSPQGSTCPVGHQGSIDDCCDAGGSEPPVPVPPSEGLVQWLKTDVGITLVAGRVASWADQSGFAQDVAQPQVSDRPYMLGDTIDGIPLMTFGAGGDANKFLFTAGVFVDRFSVPMDGAAARTVMIVQKPRFDAAYGRTGGHLWLESTSWCAMFELRSDFVPDGAYAWM